MQWGDFVALAIDEIRIYGADSLQVLRRLRSMLEDLVTVAGDQRRPALNEQLRLLSAAAERGFPDARDRRAAGLGDTPGTGS